MTDSEHLSPISHARQPMLRFLLCIAFCLSLARCASLDVQEPPQTPKMTVGVHVTPITEAMRSQTKAPWGLYVTSVDAGQPAARAGIKKGDVLLAFGERPLEDFDDLRTVLDALEAGSRITVTIWRNGVQRKLLLTPVATKPARDDLS